MKTAWLKSLTFSVFAFVSPSIGLAVGPALDLAMGASRDALAAPVEYRLEGTRRTLATCQTDADTIAAKFVGAGSIVYSASCVKDDGATAEISLFLDASTVPAIYSSLFAYRVESLSQFNSGSTPVNHRHDLSRAIGLFDNIDTCLAQAATFQDSFERQTGLSAIATQCIALGYGSGHVMQIDGFGEPRRRLTEFKKTFFTNLLSGSLSEKIADRLRNDGFDAIGLRWIGDSLLAIGWGGSDLELQSVDFDWANFFANSAECQNQSQEILKFMRNNGRPVFHAECEQTNVRPLFLLLEEAPANGQLPALVFEKFGRFSGFEACVARLPDFVSSTGSGYFCSLDVAFDGKYLGYRLNRMSVLHN